jgi:hypothetical protein
VLSVMRSGFLLFRTVYRLAKLYHSLCLPLETPIFRPANESAVKAGLSAFPAVAYQQVSKFQI